MLQCINYLNHSLPDPTPNSPIIAKLTQIPVHICSQGIKTTAREFRQQMELYKKKKTFSSNAQCPSLVQEPNHSAQHWLQASPCNLSNIIKYLKNEWFPLCLHLILSSFPSSPDGIPSTLNSLTSLISI